MGVGVLHGDSGGFCKTTTPACVMKAMSIGGRGLRHPITSDTSGCDLKQMYYIFFTNKHCILYSVPWSFRELGYLDNVNA